LDPNQPYSKMENPDLVKSFRKNTDASLKEAKEVFDMATEEEIENAREYGVTGIEHLLDLVRNPDLWKRLATLMEQSCQWWYLDKAASVLGVSTYALVRFLEHTDSDYRKFDNRDSGMYRNMVGPRKSVYISEFESPRQHIGEVTEW